MYAYVRRQVTGTHEAQDLTQSFFAELLEKNLVGAATPERGRFRAFLLTACKHYLSKQWRKDKAKKRGGGKRLLSLDFQTVDSKFAHTQFDQLTAEELYDRQWAVTLLDEVMRRLESEFNKAGKHALFERLKNFIVMEANLPTYAEAGAGLGITEAAAKMAASRLRRRYRQLLREEIAHTVAGPDDVEDEIRSLFTALGK